ncbi:MAG: PucR family transcriptional regulator [Clostridia bacterium]|nr:PucR family transcriptional regulator [Clostridia bacterium]
MIRIRELYRLQNLGGLRLIAGESGVERTVTAAVLFEYDPSRMQLPDFYRGDLVVTTLAYARGDAQLVSQSLLALMKQGVAGLLVKTAYFRELPDDVIRTANELGTPMFLFDDTYIEEVILEVTELIRGRRHFAGYEKELDALMRGDMTADQVRERVARINPAGAGAYRICALLPCEHMPGLDDRLYEYLTGNAQAMQRCIVMEWRRMLLVLCRCSGEEQEDTAWLRALLAGAGISAERLYIGVGGRREDAAAFGMALCEAVYAARAAKLERRGMMSAGKLGLYAWLFPMSENGFVSGQCRQTLAKIRQYDAQNRTNLEATARAYVEAHMEIAAAAKALYQHPNTVRYRLSKIQRLMGVEDDALFTPMVCLMISLSRILEEDTAGGRDERQ